LRHACSQAWRSEKPVISVGNIVAGGTGKTVLVDYLVDYLIKDQVGAVVSRGYRAEEGDSLNDEMKLLSQHHPSLICEANPQRQIAIEKAVKAGAQWVLMDDGFQHRKVHRDLNLLLLDATDPFSKGMLPYGRRREPLSAILRADLIVLSHADCIEPQDLKRLKNLCESVYGKKVVAGKHSLQKPQNSQGDICPLGPVHLLAGLANVKHFENALVQMGYQIQGKTLPGDHLKPSEKQMQELKNLNIPVVCTEKDIVKQTHAMTWYVAPVKWQFIEGESLLIQKLKETIHA
jgi:tetraacyldisaccharide 4'-kinase